MPTVPRIRKLLILNQLPDLPGIAMLPRSLVRAGFEVGVVSSPQSVLPASRYAAHAAAFQTGHTPESVWETLAEAARQWPYDLVLPAEDFSARLLREYADRFDDGRLHGPLGDVIRRSVVPRNRRAQAYVRAGAVAAAADLGIRVPPQIQPSTISQVRAFCQEWGLPVVVKRDNSMGGSGVSIMQTADAAAEAARSLRGRATVERFVDGQPASVSFACTQGRLLGAFCYAALVRHPAPTGPATVIEVIDRPDMVDAARRLASHFRFTGIAGLDFVIDTDGTAWFLEMNPRLPQTANIGGEIGCDLCAALFEGLNGSGKTGPLRGEVGRTLALFPSEWQRSPDSPYLKSAAPPIPWDDARLVSAIMRRFAPALDAR
jgi:hypothetical protein